MPAADRESRRNQGPWIVTRCGTILYRPDRPVDKQQQQQQQQQLAPQFPAPLIAPRRTRPHSIHIVTYPPGYVPRELRPRSRGQALLKTRGRPSSRQRSQNLQSSQLQQQQQPSTHSSQHHNHYNHYHHSHQTHHHQQQPVGGHGRVDPSPPILPALGKFLASFTGHSLSSAKAPLPSAAISAIPAGIPTDDDVSVQPVPTHSSSRRLRPRSRGHHQPTAAVTGPSITGHSGHSTGYHTGGLLKPLPSAAPVVVPAPAPAPSSHSHHLQHPTSLPPLRRSGSRSRPLESRPSSSRRSTSSPPPPSLRRRSSHRSRSNPPPPAVPTTVSSTISTTTTMATVGRVSLPPNSYHNIAGNRSSFLSTRSSSKLAVSSLVTEIPKPVASGSGVSCSILLAEPDVFLTGFDHDGHSYRDGQSGTALLRGKLQLNITKNVKIKAVQLKLLGRARTEWPEGIPPLKQDLFQEESLRTQVLTFFNAVNDGWESEYGNQCTYKLKDSSANSSSINLAVRPHLGHLQSSSSQRSSLSAKELKRLSLQSVQSRSFNKGESGLANPLQAKGYKVFYPGTYDYTFELPIDHHQLETTKLQYGSVKWELHATIDRAGAFKPNLHGMKEVSIIRLPDQLSLEMSEPISINRTWEDQLHYDIIISGKSFPIGSKIPIAFKLTPLAKVQVHKLKVYLTESIEYWTTDKRVTRKDPGRKILLLEKLAGKPIDSAWASSELTTVSGGELTAEQRREARDTASRRRAREAARHHTEPRPLPSPADNLLGDLDLGLESMWGSTEIEANIQIPTCEMMAKNKELRLHPDCSWKNVNVFHWIKVVMRISRLDPDDPSGTKRRHFEISIDSPLTILNCRATQANTNLPAYSGPACRTAQYQSACGCPDSATVAMDTSPSSSTGTLPSPDGTPLDSMPMPPQAAHLAHTAMNPATGTQTPTTRSQEGPGALNTGMRPIHLLRAPSFSPPAFDDDTAPPPGAFPPVVVSGNAAVARGQVMTPPPQYDVIIGTPSVDGLADYFARLADYGFDGAGEESASDGDDTPPRILERSGRVNVANPRTPGGRRMPSRSLEISRPNFNLDASVLPMRANAASRAAI